MQLDELRSRKGTPACKRIVCCFLKAMETTASPHHLIGISRIHGDPRRMPDVDFCIHPCQNEDGADKRYRAWEMASMMAVFGLA